MYDRLGHLVPEGYVVEETDELLSNSYAKFFSWGWNARRHARRLNGLAADTHLYRYEVVRTDGLDLPEVVRKRRWAIVAKQNRLRRVS